MKNGSVVQPDGSLDLTNVKKLIKLAKKNGIAVYGHNLIWQEQQEAGYYNNLIAPLIVKTPPFANSLDLSSPKSGTLNGWMTSGSVAIVNQKGLTDNSKSVKLVAGSNSSSAQDLQLTTPAIAVNQFHKYKVIFYIKSDTSGEGSVTFDGLKNNSPEIDWTGSGKSKTFTTGRAWKKISFPISDFTGNSFKIHLNLGYKPNVTYYIDVGEFYVYDTQSKPVTSNLIDKGSSSFESGSNAWVQYGGSSSSGVTAKGMGLNGKGHAFFVTNPSAAAHSYSVQMRYEFPKNLKKGATYKLSFWVKGTANGKITPILQSPSYSQNAFRTVSVTTNWKHVVVTTKNTAADRNRVLFNIGLYVGTVYLDNIKLVNAAGASQQTITVQKSAQMKNKILSAAMKHWIKGIVSNTPYVDAWDVLNEPMSDAHPNQLKTGVGKTLGPGEFYWQDYLGKDYGVKAFKWARKFHKGKVLLFVNDYNLARNLAKCRGLINYVNYIDSHGAKVDGIGTEMHISIDVSKQKIAKMFKLLAATGKLIRVSELDIGLGHNIQTPNATPELYKKQAEMYKYVVEEYFKLIPKDQRFGITVWSPLDQPKGSSWRPGQPVGLWDLNYNRKRAYAGFAEGLKAGLSIGSE